MSFISGNSSNEAVQKFLEILQNDFRTLANETKKKYPQIKEVCTAKLADYYYLFVLFSIEVPFFIPLNCLTIFRYILLVM